MNALVATNPLLTTSQLVGTDPHVPILGSFGGHPDRSRNPILHRTPLWIAEGPAVGRGNAERNLSSSARSCANECGPVWPMPGRTASAWAGPQRPPCMRIGSANCTAQDRANRRSPAAFTSDAPRCGASWPLRRRRNSSPLLITHPCLSAPAIKGAILADLGRSQ